MNAAPIYQVRANPTFAIFFRTRPQAIAHSTDAGPPAARRRFAPNPVPPSWCTRWSGDSRHGECGKRLRCRRREQVGRNCVEPRSANDKQNRPSAFSRACNYPAGFVDRSQRGDYNSATADHRSKRRLQLPGDRDNRLRAAISYRSQTLLRF